MKKCLLPSVAMLIVTVLSFGPARAQSTGEAKDAKPTEAKQANVDKTVAAGEANPAEAAKEGPRPPKPEYPPFGEVLGDAETIDGLFKMFRKGEGLFGEVTPAHLNQDFIVAISIARGMGEQPLLGGMAWGFGDDAIWQFRKTDKKIQIVRRNVRFTANQGSPSARAVHLAYTDSVLFSLPIVTQSPGGGFVVDLAPLFMSDLPQISQVLNGFVFARDRSTWASVKGFKDNVEIQVAATYASAGTRNFDTVPDSRGVTINIHYSLSRLPQTGYRPRLADDRVGCFLTVLKDFSKSGQDDRFVRYINRWDLQKADPKADVSPPKNPIVFWLEKTIPFEYRKPIRDGILEWNKAFEKAGFANAIEVRQQPDDATWDPEDINYNTFRWITASAGFAMGPSRVNPTTGQILDADVIFDADLVELWRREYEIMTPKTIEMLTGGPLDLAGYHEQWDRLSPAGRHGRFQRDDLAAGMAREFAFGAAFLAAQEPAVSKAQMEKLVMQGVQSVATHEVGHTLGLRHNFKASTLLTLDEINDPKKTAEVGLAASVMDYLPVNLAPKGKQQGDYFSTVIGPYDYWVIEYGYKTLGGGAPDAELPELRKIASRSAEPALDYATDEDTRGVDPDPLCNRFDLGKDPLAFSKGRAELIGGLWTGLAERMTEDGEGYQRALLAFNVLLSNHGKAMHFASRYVGGLYVHRDHKGDKDARPPVVVVEPERQREALALLEAEVLGEKAYAFPVELLNYLAPSRWLHWGSEVPDRVDYPVQESIRAWQDRVLAQLLSPLTLARIADSEMKVPADKDAFTTAELFERLTGAVFSETERLDKGKFTNRAPAIAPARRNLQRRYLQKLSDIILGNAPAPDDCQAVAAAELEALAARVNKVLAGQAQLDTYTRAHLKEIAARIRKVQEASVELRRP
ncbi:MAG: zinc-dependent metalloprotease [Planctomycetia bacterium]|nr:zinc-dependent metalloprotease [Planctomycetia bacterium]